MTIGTVLIEPKYPIDLMYKKAQSVGVSLSGTVLVCTTGLEETFIQIRISRDNETQADLLRTYIRTTANYSLNTFSITPPAMINLGLNTGVARTVRFWADNYDHVLQKDRKFDFIFVFRVEI